MEIFDLIRQHLVSCGIAISKHSSPNHPFNVKNLTVFILICTFVIVSLASLNDTNTFSESTDILFHSVSQGFCGLIYEIIVWKTTEINEFINSLDDTINRRE